MTDLIDEVQLTAYALGELPEDEKAKLESVIARSPEARRAVEEIQLVARMLETELCGPEVSEQAEPAMALPPAVGLFGVPPPPVPIVPNNLASHAVPENARSLEIKTIWGWSVLDTLSVTHQPVVELGDENRVRGVGPFQRVVRPDLQIPAHELPLSVYPLAVSEAKNATRYRIQLHTSFKGTLERADGSSQTLAELRATATDLQPSELPGVVGYQLKAEETLYLHHGGLMLQLRYVRRAEMQPMPMMHSVNPAWVNALLMIFVLHAVTIGSFLSVPNLQEDLVERLHKSTFVQVKLTPSKAGKKTDILAALNSASGGAKAHGSEGLAGRKDRRADKPEGRLAIVEGNPDDKDIAKNGLAKLFDKGPGSRGYLFGTGELGGELSSALGHVQGIMVGDASGMGGLGTRGSAPGGGGLAMNSVSIGGLATVGPGGGRDPGYGSGLGNLGPKIVHRFEVVGEQPTIMGSLDREVIRRVIDEHRAQVRYCYERALTKDPGLFGKVVVQWVIGAGGRVQSPKLKESTINNADVESCLIGRIESWQFPEPRGGGTVLVNYPFVFRRSG